MLQFNKYQTQLTDELLDSLHKEVKEELIDLTSNVEYIKRMISPNRQYAKDRPRDEKGRIIVDISNPHILEDMDYFTPIANFYREHKVITKLRPNANPNSEFGKWIRTEIDRIWYGMVRESDGEWITGQMYFYLNYMPIIQTKVRKGKKIGDRVVDLPLVWDGVYLWFHYLHQAREGGIYNNFEGGQHGGQIAARGRSKSYSCASMLARLFILGDNEDSCERTRGVINAADKEKLIKDGTLNKFADCLKFCEEHTQFPSERLKTSLSDMTWIMGYIETGTNKIKGTENTILGVTVGDDTGKSRGKRSNIFLYEEFGAFPKFIDVWNTNFDSVQEGSIAFGQAIFIGTGGEEGNDFAGALEMIYNPIGYNVYSIPNIYDKNAQGKSNTIFFYSAAINRKGHYDENGNSNIISALIEILEERVKVKYNSTDPMSLTRKKAEHPITLQEAIMKRESTIYPVSDLTDRINELDFNPHSLDDILVGKLAIKGDKVVYELDSDVKPIREFPHKDNKLKGAIEIHQLPKLDSNGKVTRGRYIAGIDTFDDDESETLSLGSIYILDLYTDELVFEYAGRDQFADDFYEICRRALLYYNAEANYENNKKGLFTYFSKHNCLYLLSDTLEFLKDKEMMRYGTGNKSKGSLSTAPIKGYYRRCIRDYLLKPVSVIKVIDVEEEEVKVPMLFKMKSRALLKELTLWSADGNYDRHDAFGMLMLIREDKLRLLGGNTPDEYNKQRDSNYLGEDKFFTDNYRVDRVKNILNF